MSEESKEVVKDSNAEAEGGEGTSLQPAQERVPPPSPVKGLTKAEKRSRVLAMGKDAIACALFQEMAKGGTLATACKAVGIRAASVIRWAASDRNFREAFHRAREQQAHALVDEALTIADEPVNAKDVAAVQRNRLRVETRKWFASHIVPRLYGTRESTELGGNVGQPVAVRVIFVAEARRLVAPLPEVARDDTPDLPPGEQVAQIEAPGPGDDWSVAELYVEPDEPDDEPDEAP